MQLFLSLASSTLLPLIEMTETPTCHQGALRRALLHEYHVLKQWTVPTVATRSSSLSQVGAQMATREKRRAKREGRLQTAILLG